MKIGIDGRLWNETGVGRYIRNLVLNLIEIDKKNEYVLFVAKEFKNDDLRFKNEKWRIVDTDIHWHSFREQLEFPKIIEKERVDLVHFPYFSVPIFYNKPFVVTIHDLIINSFPTGKASTLPLPYYYCKLMAYKYVVKHAIKNSQKIIAVSQTTKKEILGHYKVSPAKIAVTYEGIDEGFKNYDFGYKNKKENYFLYVGNAYPHKNLQRMLDAFASHKLQITNYKLLLVGRKDYFYKKLEQKVNDLGLSDLVELRGFVTDKELYELYRNAKATIIPSLMEGFSLPGLEAMSNGCLVIASDIPIHKEIFKDAALYFDPYQAKSLTDVLYAVLNNKNSVYGGILHKGKKRVEEFSWKKTARHTLMIYKHALS